MSTATPHQEHDPAGAAASLRAAFAAETRAATRASGTLVGAVALVAVPACTVVDRLLEPAHAPLLWQLRLVCTAVVLVAWAVLMRTPLGARRPEAVMFVLFASPVTTVAYMLALVDRAGAVYATGLSIAIYGSAFLLVWSWRHLAWRELTGRVALEREQERNRDLLERLDHLARQDDLTGLANRRSWNDVLAHELRRSRRSGAPLAVLLIDLAELKQVNDVFGHLAGDAVLRTTAAQIAGRVRAADVAARLGGDEFAVVCPDTTRDDALVLARDLQLLTAHPPLPDGTPSPTTISVGIAVLGQGDVGGEDLVARADRELYRAKRTRTSVCAA